MAIIHSLKCVPFSFVVPLLSLALTHCHLLSCVVTRCITRCHSLPPAVPLVVTHCHSLSLVPIFVTLSHSLPFVVTRCPSLSLVVPLVVVTCYHSLSLVATRRTTRLSFYKQSPQTAKIRIKSFWVTSVSILKYLHI